MNADPDLERRFGGIERLYAHNGLAQLKAAKITVVGIGGVGSWVAEALARSAVGTICLIDLDDICESNVNRQIHALTETVGAFKVEAMAERIAAINPACTVLAETRFFTEKTSEELLDPAPDVLVDCIDSMKAKCLMLATCRDRGIPAITVGAAGGRCDPTRIQSGDLGKSMHDPLLARVRKRLRQEYGFPRKPQAKFGISCVYSDEPMRYPEHCDAQDPDTSLKLDCETGYGTASFVTGTFGFFAAALAVNHIVRSTK